MSVQWGNDCIHDTTSRSNWVWQQLGLLWNKQKTDCRTLGEIERGTWPASSMQYAASSDTRHHQWFAAVCNAICLWWYQKQDFGRCEGCKMESSEKEKHNQNCAWLDSLHQHLAHANYLAYLLKHYKLQNHPSLISHKWHLVNGLCLPVRSTQPPLPQSMQLPQAEMNSSGESSESEDTDSAAVYTVDHVVIVNRVMRVNKRCIRIVKWQLIM